MVQLTLAPVFNESLFSVHYLEERLKDSDRWKKADGAEVAFEEIKEIYKDKKDVIETYTNNEAQLEMDFIRPILKVLGHNFNVQATIQERAKRPDYAFFEDEEDKREAFKNKESDDFYKDAIAVGDAKAWDKNLDKKLGGRDVFENQNPSYQIDYYLRVTSPEWGILTNGRRWRLYFEGCPQPIGTYYEVDLIDILEKDDLENFKYFYLFFKRGAFVPVGESFLDRVYNQSLRYAEEIGENLEENVYKALLWMAKGYFNMDTNNLEKNEENVKWVHENSLIFLYRLLFLFYTESKGMLGTEVPRKYANEYSFEKWVEDILNDIDNDDVGEQGGLYNHRLFSIFKLVREGSEVLGIPREEFYIPAYNGGLFDNEKHPFLRNKKIQDGHIARVVDLLARVTSKEHRGRSRVDYSDLSIRHLGGIYEGLLEYKPKLADQDMVAVKKKRTLKWIPVSKAKKEFSEFEEDKRVQKGELYLVTDKGERKATGSYYTPDYIVKYIVENTVGPVIEEKLEDAETNEEKREAVLETKILDPAMGSGHFLVEATDFLANELVKYIEEEEEKERDIDWAKRKVARNCVYGVDVNPLATELAKVSLWLNTMAEDKPLSFLDHHLKTGNSLIGADIHGLDKHPEDEGKVTETGEKTGQLALLDFFGKDVRSDIKELLAVYSEMLDVTEESPEDIKEQEDLFQKFEDHSFKKKFDVLADVQTSYYFGNEFSKTQYENLLNRFRGNKGKWKKITNEEWVKKASDSVSEKIEDNLSDENRFFHWKLEFPEVFFNIGEGTEKSNPGFDVVLGNPPWVIASENIEEKYFSTAYQLQAGQPDLYRFFIERCMCLTNNFFSMIAPSSWLTIPAAQELRVGVVDAFNFREIVLPPQSAFKGVSANMAVFVLTETLQTNEFYVGDLREDEEVKNRRIYHNSRIQSPDYTINPYISDVERDIFEKMEKERLKLGEIADLTVGYQLYHKDIHTPDQIQNKVFHSGEKKSRTYVSEIRSGSLERYYIASDNPDGYVDKSAEFFRIPPRKFREGERILLREITSEYGIVACKATEELLFPKSVMSLVVEDTLSVDFVLALINSKALFFAFLVEGEKAHQKLFPRLSGKALRELPLPGSDSKTVVKLVRELQKKVSLEKREVSSFLKWLSREWNCDIDDLSLKTRLQEYWKHCFDEMLQIAKRNKKQIDGDPSSRKFQEKLEKEWKDSMNTLKPLMEKIQDLENQIDALVFKLYDLRENEVEVVLDSLETEEEIKQDILEKFEKLKE